MSWFNHLSLRWKLWLAFGSILTMLVIQYVDRLSDNAAAESFLNTVQQQKTTVMTLTEVYQAMASMPDAHKRFLLTGEATDLSSLEEKKAAFQARIDKARKELSEQAQMLQVLAKADDAVIAWEKALVNPTVEKRQEIAAGKGTLLELSKTYDALVTTVSLQPALSSFNEQLAAADEVLSRQMSERKTKQDESARQELYTLIAVITMSMLVAFLVSGSLSRRINHTVDVLEAVAAGDFNQSIDEDGRDEVGRMRAAVNHLTRSIGERVSLLLKSIQATADGDLTQEIQVHGSDPIGQIGESLEKLMISLRQSIGTISKEADKLAEASERVKGVTHDIQTTAEQASQQSNAVTIGSEEVSRSVQTVAAATEEMSASIKEIAKNAADAAKVATDAVKAANATNHTISRLGESSSQIGNVVKVITTIAQQTNLLALNATIEAARAGEAGKGFAVVANEVKALAQETAKATEDISKRVEAIQADTRDAVTAIAQISTVINHINDISSTIASAVEEQTATTNEISRSVADAARGSSEIVHNIMGVAEANQRTSGGIRDVSSATENFARSSAQLREAVGNFQLDTAGGRRATASAHGRVISAEKRWAA